MFELIKDDFLILSQNPSGANLIDFINKAF